MRLRDLRKYSPLVHLQQALERQRLLQTVFCDPPLTARTTMIVAPAGFGKSTLLAQAEAMLRSEGQTTLWINCDEAEKSPGAFLESLERAMYMAAISCQFGSGFDQILSELESSSQTVSLFLDQYERVSCDEVDRLIERFALANTTNFQLVIGSRLMPLLPVAQLQLNGVIRVLDPESLRFTHSEVEDLLGIDQKQLARRWFEYSGGWPFALQLLRLCSRQDFEGSIRVNERKLPTGQIFEYLAEEVFSSWTEELREFMLDCCILEDIDVGAVNALRVRHDGVFWLHQAAALSPIVVISEQPLTARLHPLLRDFLRNRLEESYPSRSIELHKKAAYHFALRKDIFSAVSHCVNAGLFDLACKLILEAGALRLLISEGPRRVKAILELLPDAYMRAQPRIRLILVGLRLVDTEQVEGVLDLSRLESFLSCGKYCAEDKEDSLVDLRYARTMVSIHDLTRSNHTCSQSLIRNVLQDARARFFEDPRYLCLCLPTEIMFLQRYGRIGLVIRRVDEFMQINRAEGFKENAPWSSIYKALSDVAQARFSTAAGDLENVVGEDLQSNERSQTFTYLAHALLGLSQYAMGRLELANQVWSRCAAPLNIAMVEVWEGAVIGAARAEFFQDREIAAIERLTQIRASVESDHHLGLVAAATLIELYLRAECYAEAKALAHEIQLERLWRDSQARPEALWADSFAFAQSCFWLYCAEHEWLRAEEVANNLVTVAHARERWCGQAVAMLLRAHSRLSMGREGAAKVDISQAAVLLSSGGGVQYFIETGELVICEVRNLIDSSDPVQSSFARVIIAEWERNFHARISALAIFTIRERDVLMGLAAGQSTKSIAKELVISPETVKQYLKSIFVKLKVGNRHEAVSAARRRAIIS